MERDLGNREPREHENQCVVVENLHLKSYRFLLKQQQLKQKQNWLFYIPQNNEVERNQRSGNEHQKIQNWMIAAGLRWESTKPFKYWWSEIVSHLNLVPLSSVERKLEKFPDLDYEVLKKNANLFQKFNQWWHFKVSISWDGYKLKQPVFFFPKSMIMREFTVQKTVYFSKEMYLL